MSAIDDLEEFDPVDYLKTLPLEDFLNNENTKNILLEDNQYNFDKILKHKIEYLYKKYNTGFRDNNLFGKDWNNQSAESFSHLISNFISLKPNLNIFYENPELASDLFKLKE